MPIIKSSRTATLILGSSLIFIGMLVFLCLGAALGAKETVVE